MKRCRVVYSVSYGVYSLSDLAKERLKTLGVLDPSKVSRHDERLVTVVEELGEKSSDNKYGSSKLGIHALKGKKYIIREYDGLETVIEPQDIDWIEVDD